MVQIFIQVLEFSLAAAIVVSFILGVCLRRGGLAPALFPSGEDKRLFAVALAVGTLAALVIAILRRTTAWINMSFWSTAGMSVALISGIVFIAGFRRKADGFRLSRIGGALCGAAVLFYTLPRVFLIPGDFLTAEESAASTDFLFKCAAYLAGLFFVLLTACIITKTTLSHDGVLGTGSGKAGFNVAQTGGAAALVIELFNDIAQITQFLFARRVIPMNRDVFKVVAFLRNNSGVFLFVEIAALLLFAALVFTLSIFAFRQKRLRGNPAEKRKTKADFRGQRRRFVFLTALACFSLVSLTALKAWTQRTVTLSPPEPYHLENGEISIGLDQISDGHLHRFAWMASENVEVRFIVIKKNESSFGVGLDACDICGATGYYERKDGVICMLCDVVMNKNTIGFKGGCNPVPLAYTIQGGSMVVRCEDLDNERGRFK
jgi:uncharacterized membrane protein